MTSLDLIISIEKNVIFHQIFPMIFFFMIPLTFPILWKELQLIFTIKDDVIFYH